MAYVYVLFIDSTLTGVEFGEGKLNSMQGILQVKGYAIRKYKKAVREGNIRILCVHVETPCVKALLMS
jgi:hypothetical protein